jgi:hypothetical protein
MNFLSGSFCDTAVRAFAVGPMITLGPGEDHVGLFYPLPISLRYRSARVFG